MAVKVLILSSVTVNDFRSSPPQGREDFSMFPPKSLEKEMATHSSLLAWRIPWRSLVGYSPWGCRESDRTEQHHFHFLTSWKRHSVAFPLQVSNPVSWVYTRPTCIIFCVVPPIYWSYWIWQFNGKMGPRFERAFLRRGNGIRGSPDFRNWGIWQLQEFTVSYSVPVPPL